MIEVVRKLFQTTRLELECDRCKNTFSSTAKSEDHSLMADNWIHGRFEKNPVIRKEKLDEVDLCPKCTKAYVDFIRGRFVNSVEVS